MDEVREYLERMWEIRRTGGGTAETSYYGPLEALLRAVGGSLLPEVIPLSQLANSGAGSPDFGLFSVDQFSGTSRESAVENPGIAQQKWTTMPARGVVEVKSPKEQLEELAKSSQVAKYDRRYGLVLVTNYRQFATIVRTQESFVVEEIVSIADTESSFWAAVSHSAKTAEDHGEAVVEFLRRALARDAPLEKPKDVAWFLASHAKDLRRILSQHSDHRSVQELRAALELGLGQKLGGQADFFPSALAQTILYGLFSSWILWAQRPNRDESFVWTNAIRQLRVPVLRALVARLTGAGITRKLGIETVIALAGKTLARVDPDAFLTEFRDGEHAILHFYEPFLEQFDPELRKEMGVWYTPHEVVKFIVERVDRALRECLGCPGGLADEQVYVLDPAAGTGSFIVEVIRKIHQSLIGVEPSTDLNALIEFKKAAMERVFGFEILPAAYVSAHIQIDMVLAMRGVQLDPDERASIFLTNALTGWEEVDQRRLPMEELEEERDAAQEVKQEKPILVVLGNPPYNAFAGVAPETEHGMIEDYKHGLNKPLSKGGWGVRKFNLDDLYVRFLRIAERRVAEQTGRGIICYITPHSWLDDTSFVVMRERLLGRFSQIWIDDLHGDSRETGKLTPDGRPDPSIFSTSYSPAGIPVGTAVSLLVCEADQPLDGSSVWYREWWGKGKRQRLLALGEAQAADPTRPLAHDGGDVLLMPNPYRNVKVLHKTYLSLRPLDIEAQYFRWPQLTDIAHEPPINGLMEKRKGALIDIDKDVLSDRLHAYFEAADWDEAKAGGHGLVQDAARFSAHGAWTRIRRTEAFDPEERIVPYLVRAFDSQWCYYTTVRPLWNEPRPDYWRTRVDWSNRDDTQAYLVSRFRPRKDPGGPAAWWTRGLVDDHFYDPDTKVFPVLRADEPGDLFEGKNRPNLSRRVIAYLAALGLESNEEPALIWKHALAVACAPWYLKRYADAVQHGWPFIPLPGVVADWMDETSCSAAIKCLGQDDERRTAALAALHESAELGSELARLLDGSESVPGVTRPPYISGLSGVASLALASGDFRAPSEGERCVDIVWGHWGKVGRNDAIMPGRGLIEERPRTEAEERVLEEGADRAGIELDEARQLMCDSTVDIYLNEHLVYRNVPRAAWEFTTGGYQVLKKWLSYRVDRAGDRAILGRPLKDRELALFGELCRRITAILWLTPRLNINAMTAVRLATSAPKVEELPRENEAGGEC